MHRLFKRNGPSIDYHEAWAGSAGVVEHWGACGSRGETKQHFASAGQEANILDAIFDRAVEAGFAPIAEEDFDLLLVQSPIDGSGTPANLAKRHALEDYLNGELGWLGLGFCDGGSIGSGSMEAACFVVDFDIAAAALTASLAQSAFAGFVIAKE